MKCGCVVADRYNHSGIYGKKSQYVEFCPLHAAAGEMLEALKIANVWLYSGDFEQEGILYDRSRVEAEVNGVLSTVAKVEWS